jgi:hypothetical protein
MTIPEQGVLILFSLPVLRATILRTYWLGMHCVLPLSMQYGQLESSLSMPRASSVTACVLLFVRFASLLHQFVSFLCAYLLVVTLLSVFLNGIGLIVMFMLLVLWMYR